MSREPDPSDSPASCPLMGNAWLILTRSLVFTSVILSGLLTAVWLSGSGFATLAVMTGTLFFFLLMETLVLVCRKNKAATKIRESELSYRKIFEQINDGILVVSREDNTIRYANQQAHRLLDFSQELVGRNLQWMSRALPQSSWINRILENPEGHFDAMLQTRSGRQFSAEISSKLVNQQQPGRQLLVIHSTDEKKKAEAERNELETLLLHSQKMESVGRLAGGIAHDFNNLLTVITGRAELGLIHSEPGSEIHEEFEEIKQAGQKAAKLTNQLLAFSRKQLHAPRLINLNQLLTGASEMLQRLIGEDVELITELADDLWNVRMDPGQMEQVIFNLAVNARDAMTSGGRLTIRTFNRAESKRPGTTTLGPGEYVVLEVTDTGQGMDDVTLQRIFEPFFTTKTVGKGTGLGLSTAYGIIRQHEGQIIAKSVPGEGSVFIIHLPALPREAASSVDITKRYAQGL